MSLVLEQEAVERVLHAHCLARKETLQMQVPLDPTESPSGKPVRSQVFGHLPQRGKPRLVSLSQRNREDSPRELRQTRNAFGGLSFPLSPPNPSPKRPEQKKERDVYEKITHLLPQVQAVHCRFEPHMPYTEQREQQDVEERNSELNVRLEYHSGCIISLLPPVYSY